MPDAEQKVQKRTCDADVAGHALACRLRQRPSLVLASPRQSVTHGNCVLLSEPQLSGGVFGCQPKRGFQVPLVPSPAHRWSSRQDAALVRRRRGFEPHPVLSIAFDKSRTNLAPEIDVAAAYGLAMTNVRVQLPLSPPRRPHPISAQRGRTGYRAYSGLGPVRSSPSHQPRVI